MPFNSYPYFIFLAVAVLGYRLLESRAPAGRRVFLLLASYAFYAWWRAEFLALLIGSTVINYMLGREIELRRTRHADRRLFLIGGLIFNLGLIAIFKYQALFVTTANTAFNIGLPVAEFFLPLAISFFTFEQISYLVDADSGKTRNYSLLDYSLFVAYFPHLIAGPIVRHNDLIPQFHAMRSAPGRDLAAGITLFTIGLAKKTLIADNLAPFADAIFNAAGRGAPLGLTDSWLGTLFFTFQIYFDFSAYSDMALGSAVMLGIRLPVNFLSPYKAASIIEFWRRWHISLSAFLRDYLYIPLGGNRGGAARRYLNLFITMLLGGLWHGANWTFMLWGGLHGLYLAINHAFRHVTKGMTVPPALRLPLHALSVLLTFAAISFAWIVFRAETLTSAGNVAAGLIGLGDSGVVSFSPLAAVALILLFGIVWFMPNSMEIMWRHGNPALPSPYENEPVKPARRLVWAPTRLQAFAYGILCIVAVLALSNLKPFIYFQF
jgi:D-alanyl-lipoteichoic acid acyltransferase DltB (MBOAT superfamily)